MYLRDMFTFSSSSSKTLAYDRLPGGEKNLSDDDSCTEDGSQEDGLVHNTRKSGRVYEIKLRINRSVCIWTSIAFLVVVVVVSIVSGIKSREQQQATSHFPTYPMPDFPEEPVRFMAQSAYELGSMPETDLLWDELIPRHDAVFEIDNPEMYGLGPGAPVSGTNDTQAYMVTWTHMLHCVRMVRMEFWELIRGESDLKGSDPRGDNLPWEAKFVVRHINHCFDYLRQYIMCKADMTIEAEAPRMRESDPHHINGMGTWHMCKKREPVLDFFAQHVPRDAKLSLPEFKRPPPNFKEFVESNGQLQ